MHHCSLIKQWFETILLPGVLILLVSTKKSRLGEKGRANLKHSSYSLWTMHIQKPLLNLNVCAQYLLSQYQDILVLGFYII